MQTLPNTTNTPVMRVLPAEKLRVNLYEYRYLEQAVEDTAIGAKPEAIQAIVCYAKLHLQMCLKDEAAALLHKLNTAPSEVQLTAC